MNFVRSRLGKISLVTGASRGIGKAIALAFAREGAHVVVNYATRDLEAAAVVTRIRERGKQAIDAKTNVAQRVEVEAMANLAYKTFGRADILVNNAEIMRSGDILTLNDEEWDLNMDVNVKGILNCTRAVAKGMIERHYGSIINIVSIAGIGTAIPGTTPYAVSKAAAITLTKRFALELGPYGVRVNAIAPGIIKTEMTALSLRDMTPAIKEKTMLRMVGEPDHIANTALFFASDESGFVTG
jgi:3-oxoacyl-[acyl-carrier protein] reductase